MNEKMVEREVLSRFLADELQVTSFKDYCPNGLQVEGRSEIKRLVSGVTASLALIEKAIEAGADAILVHHGYFWRGEDARIVGQKQKRLKLLLQNDISLFAYHLPLDAHPELGNNAQLAKKLGLVSDCRFGADKLGWIGKMQNESIRNVGELAQLIQAQLGRAPMIVGDPNQQLGRIAWCTGAAQSMFGEAIDAGASIYLSGEISEPTVHLAREMGVAYLACGHHATERYGVQALAARIEENFNIQHQFIDIENPV